MCVWGGGGTGRVRANRGESKPAVLNDENVRMEGREWQGRVGQGWVGQGRGRERKGPAAR